MDTKRLLVVAAALAGILALPGSAGAQASGSDCSYTTTGDPTVGVQAGSGGMTGDPATTAVGACVNAPTPVNSFQGGSGEVGAGPDGTYAVIDGDNENRDPADGYMGLSNYEDGSFEDANCGDGPDQGDPDSTNSGGCFGVDGGPWIDLEPILPISPMCGNSSGNSWNNTNRDGCSNP